MNDVADRPEILLVTDEEPFASDPFCQARDYVEAPLSNVHIDRLPHAPHLGVVLLGTQLRQRGLRPAVIDNLSRIPGNMERFREALRAGVPVVGVSTSHLFERGTVGGILREIRRLNPDAVVILGGRTAALYPCASASWDVTVRGYAEKTLPELVMALRRGRSLEGIPNLILNRSGRLEHTADNPELWPRAPLAPDWDLLEPRPCDCFPIEASRGCRHKCLFCTYPSRGNQVRRSADSVIAELARDRERYGARFFRFMDSNFTSYPEQAEFLCEELAAARLGAPWSCYARADDMAKRPGLAGKMRQAGCVAVLMGVESGDDDMLAAMGKGHDSRAASRGLGRAKEAGLMTCANFVIGFPGETSETVDRTLDWIGKAEPDLVSFSMLAFRPESLAWEKRGYLGLGGRGLDWRHATMDSDQAREHVARAMQAVTRGISRVSIGNELLLIRYIGYGLSAEEALDYFRAAKEWHAGGGRCEPWASDVLTRVGDRLRRIQRRWGGETLPA